MNQKFNILVVDDEEGIREVVIDMVEELGHNVFEAADALDAISVLETHPDIHLVVTDIRMPGTIDGVGLLEQIKAAVPYDTRVLMITGYTDASLEELYDIGACGLLRKPFDFDKFKVAIEESLKRFPRYGSKSHKINVDLEIKLVDVSLNSTIYANVLTLGRGGMFVKSEDLGKVDDKVKFEIDLLDSDKSSFSGIGEIVWVREHKIRNLPKVMGIRFLELEEEEESFLEAYIEHNKIISYIPQK